MFNRSFPRRHLPATFLMFVLLIGLKASPARAETSGALLARVRSYHSELSDVYLKMAVAHENQDVLSRISGDLGQFVKYGFRKFDYYFKSPDKVRIESNALLFHKLRGISIRNGDTKNFYVPALRIHKTADVTGQAYKKEDALDFGLLTGDVWDDFNIWYVRTENFGGTWVYSLGMRPKNAPNGGTMIVRLDTSTLRVIERDRYTNQGVPVQRQFYSNFVHPLPHVWLPALIKLYDGQSHYAGDLVFSKLVVNSGLSNSIF
ncbi:MAG: hypothetical protein M3Y56_06890 [Armatimonadota bacterium]|nr:hypothetical protein [Armatimonadota bacterium]